MRGSPNPEPVGSQLARRMAVAALLLAILVGGSLQPPLGWAGASELRRPLVVVPGVTGSMLRHRGTGEVVWGTGERLIHPRDGGYAVFLSPTELAPPSEIEAFAVIEEIGLGPYSRDIYGPIVRLLEADGYRRGSLRAPRPGDTLYLFAYDWRYDNVRAAEKLRQRLEQLRRVRGEQRLAVDLLCQSNGAHVCRYFVKYGGASLAAAEAGRAGPPATVEIGKLILVGSSNGGSLRSLRELDRGRKYVPLIGRKIQPETLFTFRSLFQDLPVYRSDLFLDAAGRPLAIDLFDPASWERYGWSIFGPEARRRMARQAAPEIFGNPPVWSAYLGQILDQARRFHRLLRRDVEGFGATRYYLIQNVYKETPERAVLVAQGDGWEMLFTGDEKLRRRRRLHALATARGDGHATVASQMWLSPQETAALAAPPFHVRGKHFDLILDPATQRRLVEFLHDGDGRTPTDPPR